MSGLIIPSPVRPSYKTGFAHHAGESAYPSLWGGLVGAWVPELDSQIALTNHVDGIRATAGAGLAQSDKMRFKGVACINYSSLTTSSLSVVNRWGINPRNTPTTVMSRCNIDVIKNYNVIFQNAAGNAEWLVSRAASINAYSYISANTFAGTDFVAGQWSTICTTIAANGAATAPVQCWLDGLAGAALVRTIPSVTDDYIIGAHHSTNSWSMDGKIAETYLWDRVLQPAEIRQIQRDPLAPFRRRRFVASTAAAAAAGFKPWFTNVNRLSMT